MMSRDPVAKAHASVGTTKTKASKVTPLAIQDSTLPLEGEEDSEQIVQLVRKETEALRAAGFNVFEESLATVETLSDFGQDAIRYYTKEARKLPTIAQAAQTHEKTIAKECRKDHTITLASYRLDACGWIRRVLPGKGDQKGLIFQKEAAPISEVAFGQLRGFYDSYQKKQRKLVKAPSRAFPSPVTQRDPGRGNVNAWIGKLDNKQARMRVRTVAEQREVFAFTGYSSSKLSYTPFDTNVLLSEAARLVPDGVRCDVKYDIETARMRARCIVVAPIDIASFSGVGRIHQLGFDLSSGDDGTMGIFVRPFVIRAKCRNASLILEKGLQSNFRHVGGFDNLKASLSAAINNAGNAIDAVRSAWAFAAGNYFLDEEGEKLNVEETIRRLVYGEYVPLGGVSQEGAVENYLRAWRAEEVYSAQGILMAIQRAAHEGSWQTTWADEDIEEAASQLLYSRVLTLPAVEEPFKGEDGDE